VDAGASVAAGAEVAGACVAAAPPHAVRIMLARTNSDIMVNKRFIFLSPPKSI
jgi:hypothetical protein